LNAITKLIATHKVSAFYTGGDEKKPDGHPTQHRAEMNVNAESFNKLNLLLADIDITLEMGNFNGKKKME